MAIQQLAPEKLRTAATELERCLYNHDQWLDGLFGTLICRLQPDERDVDGDAHRHCRLGQWYYSGAGAAAELLNRPGFAELGTEHERMHHFAARMLCALKAGGHVALDDYEHFINALKRMRMEIFTLKHDIESALHNLDPLTGIPGRQGLLATLREQQALVERGVQSCCLSIADLDHFKTVNDSFGHCAGDAVLIAFAHLMSQGLRPYDKVFRYGGEEFLIALPGLGLTEGFETIERLRKALARLPHDVEAGEPLRITASFGIVMLEPGVSVEDAIERADHALYAAKEAGRDRALIWDPSMTAALTRSSAA